MIKMTNYNQNLKCNIDETQCLFIIENFTSWKSFTHPFDINKNNQNIDITFYD